MGMILYLSGAVVAFLALARVWDRTHFRRLAARRAGENFDTFRAAFASEQAPEDVLRAVYRFFQSCVPVPDFPVRADDHIERVYSVPGEELDAAVRAILTACGFGEPTDRHRALMPPVHTVRDLVRAILKCPKA